MKISSPKPRPTGRPLAERSAAQPVVRAGKMLMLHRQLQTVPQATATRRRSAQ